ncbi:MAG: metal-dependent hydrolase [Gammaproteobacteria bacterium]
MQSVSGDVVSMAATGTGRPPAAKKSRKPAGAAVGIPPRQVDFRFPEDSPRYFYANNATATLFFAMLSSWFPPGERYFMESVRRFRDKVTDEKLKAEISGFMGQEAIHGREHERLNDLLSSRGIDVTTSEIAVRIGLGLLERLPASTQLATTTFMEHFTALLAEQLLNDEQFRRQADPEMIKLWQWHALEELEHKAVAYDVYELVGNSQRERAVAAAAVAVALVPAAVASWAWLVVKEGKATDLKDVRDGVKMLLGRGGFVTKILPKMPLFNRPQFHPNKHNTRALEAEWREKLFGDNGQLLAEFSNREAVA